jgi:L-lactate utilization protein LutC
VAARSRPNRSGFAVEAGSARRLDAAPHAPGTGAPNIPRMVGIAVMNVDARTEIMTRIRAALHATAATGFAPSDALDLGRSEPAETASVEELSARFARELAAVGGETVILTEPGDGALARAVADRVARLGYRAIAVQSDELARVASSTVPAALFIDVSGASIDRLEAADCAILAAESLIAETGSAVVRVASYEDRLLPYLPPACIIVGRASQLTPGLNDDALRAGGAERGERVIVTGPSRTADIEKTVVLGAHGPGSLTVIIAAANNGRE